MALDHSHGSRACLQRIGWYKDAASDVGIGLSIVFMVIFCLAHASLGLALSFAFGLADLSGSVLARCAIVSDATECFEGIAHASTLDGRRSHHGRRLWLG